MTNNAVRLKLQNLAQLRAKVSRQIHRKIYSKKQILKIITRDRMETVRNAIRVIVPLSRKLQLSTAALHCSLVSNSK